MSPALDRRFVDPTRVFDDLSLLAKYYRVEHVRLLGGEPLLHPKLMEVIAAVRASGISNRIRVVTNGILLASMPIGFWEEVDEVHVSIYPGKEMTSSRLRQCEEKAKDHNVNLQLLYFDRFREAYAAQGTSDKSLVERIYRTCQIAHRWRCHNISDGWFFKCPQTLFLPQMLSSEILPHGTVDGVRITDSSSFLEDLLSYLESPVPLITCNFCLGSVGRLFPHEQTSRKQWAEKQISTTESLADFRFLAILENVDPDADNLCLRSHLSDPSNRKIIGLFDLLRLSTGKSDEA